LIGDLNIDKRRRFYGLTGDVRITGNKFILISSCNSEECLRSTCHYKYLYYRSESTSYRTVAPEGTARQTRGKWEWKKGDREKESEFLFCG
jgi:hypothetical protein